MESSIWVATMTGLPSRLQRATMRFCSIGTLSAESSPYFSPLTSPPFVMGHEIVGEVVEDNGGFSAGERVVVEPALGCAVRGIDPPCAYCASGQYALCVNVAKGDIAPGIQTGFCGDTGGGWAEGTLVAFDNACPHAGSSLYSGKLDGRWLRCPSHGMRFDLLDTQGGGADLVRHLIRRCEGGALIDIPVN